MLLQLIILSILEMSIINKKDLLAATVLYVSSSFTPQQRENIAKLDPANNDKYDRKYYDITELN